MKTKLAINFARTLIIFTIKNIVFITKNDNTFRQKFVSEYMREIRETLSKSTTETSTCFRGTINTEKNYPVLFIRVHSGNFISISLEFSTVAC